MSLIDRLKAVHTFSPKWTLSFDSNSLIDVDTRSSSIRVEIAVKEKRNVSDSVHDSLLDEYILYVFL